MKTDDLISMLAGGAVAVPSNALQRRYSIALGVGAFGAILLMAAAELGVRPDIAAAVLLPMFWVKLAFVAVILVGAVWAAQRLSRPGTRLGGAPALIAVPVLVMWLLAAIALLGAAPATREALVLGMSWNVCPAYIAMLSMPAFAAALWAMKGLAPTRPVVAGAAAGLMAGALGALVYSIHCAEMAAPFIGVWYLLGISAPTMLGAVIGPRLLRW